MKAAPKGMRLHIGIFGRRNVGKSSLLNALTRQPVSIVSEIAGTTTDPVEKPMELQPVGPVLFIDTAGVDDVGVLGQMRMEKTRKIFDRTDVCILVTDGGLWREYEQAICREFRQRKVPVIAVFNKIDQARPGESVLQTLRDEKIPVVETSAAGEQGMDSLRQALVKSVPDEFLNAPTILGDLVPPGELVVFVVPIDLEAPKGRLILPQVQSIRDTLDNDAYGMVVKERELRDALERLKRPPALVVTDSQAFLKVAADTPPAVRMTSFSILFARYKGDLEEYVRGVAAIDRRHPGDSILICESCTHQPVCEDIGRVKIPRWLRQYVGGDLNFTHVQGHDFSEDLYRYKLVIQCGGCMTNRREILSRILYCKQAGVPIANYGLAIAHTLGILNRALDPFPAALEIFRRRQSP